MAANLQLLQRRIKTAKNISQISKAMEMISASKIKKAQEAVESNRPYSSRIETLTQKLLQSLSEKKYKNPYITEKKGDKTLLIVISPDKGLCGSLNTNLFKKFMSHPLTNGKVIAVGKRAELAAVRLKHDLIASFAIGTSLPSYSIINTLSELIEEQYVNGDVSKVEILYASFESFFSQKAVVTQLLPIKKVEVEESSSDLQQLTYTFEPDPQKILDKLLPTYMEVLLYRALIEAYTSEQAARMMAMQNAKNNANEIAEYLTLSYNKSRQEKITGEILDLANNQ